jgi:beta-glucosidase
VQYADFCFAQFGDRIHQWITFNEPFGFLSYAFDAGSSCAFNCSTRTPENYTYQYTQGHNVILSHGAVYRLYREKYQVRIPEFLYNLLPYE